MSATSVFQFLEGLRTDGGSEEETNRIMQSVQSQADKERQLRDRILRDGVAYETPIWVEGRFRVAKFNKFDAVIQMEHTNSPRLPKRSQVEVHAAKDVVTDPGVKGTIVWIHGGATVVIDGGRSVYALGPAASDEMSWPPDEGWDILPVVKLA